MVHLAQKPFYLTEEQCDWVRETYASMTLDEKIGQLFVFLKTVPGVNEAAIADTLAKYHQGGLRWQGGDMETIYRQNTTYQKYSKIPLFVAANCDEGGNGCLPNGTFVATAAQCGAGEGTENAYHLGLVSGREASAIACNWMFNPVVDLYQNWRNSIVNTRSFGCDADKVIANARAYIRGIKDANPNMACAAKHFPGDGVEELDQHLAMGVNDLSAEDWEASFGKVYRTLIEDGIESIMVGHIALPEMSRKLRPGITNDQIKPATLSSELLQDLLREQMGFNGLIITDASHMIGMTAFCSRREGVPGAIIAGCDMILFANNIEEDIGYVKAAYEAGNLTEQRLQDAVYRILALKAHLNLCDEAVRLPSPELLKQVGCEEHRSFTKQAADTCITLVKDTRGYLPVNPAEKKRCYLIYVGSTPNSRAYTGDPVKKIVIEELERAGFVVDVCPDFHDLEVENGVHFMNTVKMMDPGPREAFKANHDFALLVINVRGYAQENWVRLRWSCGHSQESPWYNGEIPTIGMSLNFTNHLIDVPQLHTFINAYSDNRINIRSAIEKMTGASPFLGKAEETVFCGRWDTRL